MMKYIYSESMNDMVVESFYWNGHRYVWNEQDRVFYNAETEDYFMTVPDDAY